MKLDYSINQETLAVKLCGDYLNFDDSGFSGLLDEIRQQNVRKIEVEDCGLKKWDSTLVVVLYDLARIARKDSLKLDFNSLPENLQRLIDLAMEVDRKPESSDRPQSSILVRVGAWGLDVWQSAGKGLHFMRQTFQSFVRMLFSRAVMRRVDFLYAMEDVSYRAIGIVSLVSFMVGLILAFVGAIQLKTFGAQIYVSSLVAIGMTRIMGAIMVGIIMAGRTGASYAATIGTMQVNEEIDALRTMGIPVTDFLVLPRISALVITMPFLTLLADFMGIVGGAAVGIFMLDIAAPEYWKYTLNALNMTNFLVGIFHGFVFGIVIAICGCYYGINAGRNADSVGVATTRAVVSAIVWMIVVTGIITWIFEALGI